MDGDELWRCFMSYRAAFGSTARLLAASRCVFSLQLQKLTDFNLRSGWDHHLLFSNLFAISNTPHKEGAFLQENALLARKSIIALRHARPRQTSWFQFARVSTGVSTALFTFLKSPVSTSGSGGITSMAKRFTDTGKWAKQSFSDLSLKMKLVWIYLCDNCDHAGVWDVNMALLSFQLGSKTTLPEIEKGLGDKIELRGETKIFIPSFIEFQYGALNPDNRVHQSVISRLQKLSPNKPLISPLQGAKDKDKDKEQDKDKDKDKEGGVGETNEPTLLISLLEEIWKAYPKKIGKAEGFARLEEQSLSFLDLQDAVDASKNYARYCELSWLSWYTPQNFDVWCGAKSKKVKPWRDWIKPDPSLYEEKSKDAAIPSKDAAYIEKLLGGSQ